MEIDKRCFKIDRPNAFAMINGYRKNGKINRQSIWCAVSDFPFPMLITLNRSRTPFKVNALHSSKDLEQFSIPSKYIASLDSQYVIKNDINLWKRVCDNGLFDIWDPIAPFSRFDQCKSDPKKFKIQLLRVFEISEEFGESDVIAVSSRVDHLMSTRRSITIKQPVVTDEEFRQTKSLLKKSISEFML
jgi:hypothetical protein